MLPSHATQIRVRYSETDAMRVLHHANYVNYFEVGRVEFYRAGGLDYREVEAGGHFLIVVEVACKYHAPAYYDDLLTITTTLSAVRRARLEHDHEIHRDGELLATGRTLLACVDQTGRVQRIADVMPQLLEPGRER